MNGHHSKDPAAAAVTQLLIHYHHRQPTVNHRRLHGKSTVFVFNEYKWIFAHGQSASQEVVYVYRLSNDFRHDPDNVSFKK